MLLISLCLKDWFLDFLRVTLSWSWEMGLFLARVLRVDDLRLMKVR